MTAPIRVLLVDDDPLVRSALRLMLASAADVEVVGEAADGDEVPGAVAAVAPDVVLMDLQLPRVDGIAATQTVRALPHPPQVIVLTVWDVDDAVLRSVEAGAAGFLLKSSSPTEIVSAIRNVVAGDAVLSPRSTRRLLDNFRFRPDDASHEAQVLLDRLTERERAVAVAVAGGLTNADVGAQLYLSEATVKTHLAAAQQKLGAVNRVQVAVLAERAGLLRG